MKLTGATIPHFVAERVIARRGAEHCFADLDPGRTALVVIDLQHAFMNDAVGFAAVPAARDIVPAVNRLAAAVRETGGGVFWIKMTHDERCLADWSVAFELATPAMREKRIAALSEGTLGHELWPELDVRPEDEIVKKYRYSAFMIMVSDGNAANSREEHDASLTAFYNVFGDVMDTDMIIASLRRAKSARAA
jgi:ureidoacrylate peracid hydrolase